MEICKMKQPLKEMLKKIGGGHLLKEKKDDYVDFEQYAQEDLSYYIQGLRPSVKAGGATWKFDIDRQQGSWYWTSPKHEVDIYATYGWNGKEQIEWEVEGEKIGKPDKYKAKYDLKKDAKWYIDNAKKAIPKILKTAQDGNF